MKRIVWVGNSKKALIGLPQEVKREVGFGLHLAQMGEIHGNVKPFGRVAGEMVMEHRINFVGDTFRAFYSVTIGEYVYVLHVFKKKSKSGIKTPKMDVDLLKMRVQEAKNHSKERK